MSQFTYCACSSCAAVNRINLERAADSKARCAKCHTFLSIDEGVSQATTGGLENLIKASKLPLVVDFWAEWCGPCKMFAPIFKETARSFAGSVSFAKVNTELEPMAGQTHGVRGIPTVVLYNGGREIARQSGAMPREAFASWLKNHLA